MEPAQPAGTRKSEELGHDTEASHLSRKHISGTRSPAGRHAPALSDDLMAMTSSRGSCLYQRLVILSPLHRRVPHESFQPTSSPQ